MKKMYYFLIIFSLSFIACNEKKSTETSKENSDSLNIADPVDAVVKSNSDTLVFHWSSDFCDNNGYYISSQYTQEELKNTLSLWTRLALGVNGDNPVFRPENLENIDISGMTKNYEELTGLIDNLSIVKVPFWTDFVTKEKVNIKKQYELKKMRYEAYTNPSVLLNNPYVSKDNECNQYAKALNGSDGELYKAWEDWANKAKENNGRPDLFIREFYDKYNSPDKKKYAYIDLIGFGWWNCVNRTIDYPDYSLLEQKFRDLFIKVETFNCEEP